MTTTDEPPRPSRPLLRSQDDRVLAGVAGGLGQWADLDPVIFRVAFAVLTVFGGIGLVLYGIGYLVIPDAATGVGLVSSRLLPDPRQFTVQQRTLLGWLLGAVVVLAILTGYHATPFAVLGIVAAVAALATRRRRPVVPAAAGAAYSYRPAATTSPPGGALAAERTEPVSPAWEPPSTPGPRPRTLNLVLISAALLAAGVSLLLGYAGAYQPTFLRATATALAVIGAGLVATSWWARSRVAVCVAVLLSAVVLVGSWVQGSYGSSVGSRYWRPAPGSQLPYAYKLGAGNATLDLTHLGPDALGRTVRVTMGAGKLHVLVPPSLPISAYAHVEVGSYTVFDERYSNDPVRQTVYTPGWTPPKGIRIETSLRLGDVEVDRD